MKWVMSVERVDVSVRIRSWQVERFIELTGVITSLVFRKTPLGLS